MTSTTVGDESQDGAGKMTARGKPSRFDIAPATAPAAISHGKLPQETAQTPPGKQSSVGSPKAEQPMLSEQTTHAAPARADSEDTANGENSTLPALLREHNSCTHAEGSFSWAIDNAISGRFTELKSTPFICGGIKWQVCAEPDGETGLTVTVAPTRSSVVHRLLWNWPAAEIKWRLDREPGWSARSQTGFVPFVGFPHVGKLDAGKPLAELRSFKLSLDLVVCVAPKHVAFPRQLFYNLRSSNEEAVMKVMSAYNGKVDARLATDTLATIIQVADQDTVQWLLDHKADATKSPRTVAEAAARQAIHQKEAADKLKQQASIHDREMQLLRAVATAKEAELKKTTKQLEEQKQRADKMRAEVAKAQTEANKAHIQLQQTAAELAAEKVKLSEESKKHYESEKAMQQQMTAMHTAHETALRRERLEEIPACVSDEQLFALEGELLMRLARVHAERERRRVMTEEQHKKRRECSVCFDRVQECSLQCGHIFCSGCAAQVKQCPLCRAPVTQRIKLILS